MSDFKPKESSSDEKALDKVILSVNKSKTLNTITSEPKLLTSLIKFHQLIYFGLLIGDFVPRNDPVRCIYIFLRQIIDLTTSTTLQKECCELIQTLIAEHNDLYLKFSKQHLRPKYHFILQYHTIIKKFGPLVKFMVYAL